MLAKQAYASFCIEGDDGGAAGVMDDLELGAMAVRQGHIVDGQGNDPAAKLLGAVV
jgi:hypothetical protein